MTTNKSFEQIFGSKTPEIRVRDSGKRVMLMYGGGHVSFYLPDESPGSFTCRDKLSGDTETLLTISEQKQRAIGFARGFYPHSAFQIERNDLGDYYVREIEGGIPHFSGFWLSISSSGTITNGGFPGRKGRILRKSSSVTKDVAVAGAIDVAAIRDPELDNFEIKEIRTFWIIPDIEYVNNAPEHAKLAARQRMSIKAYLVGASGFRSIDSRHQKHGSMWVDAETGRVLQGRLVKVDGIGSVSFPKIKQVDRPQHLFLDKEWRPVKTLKPGLVTATTPKGERVLVKQGNSICRGYIDKRKKLVWIPSANQWSSFVVAY